MPQTQLNLESPEMMPKTKHDMPALLVLSAMQKFIRRGLELEAMECAVELMHSSQAYCTMVLNRLQVICQEDIDNVANPGIFPFVVATTAAAADAYKKKTDNPGFARMCVANCVIMMARAPKSRRADHFQAAVGLANLLEGKTPAIPDFAFDKHTTQGKKMGRGLAHFRTEGTKLVQPDATTNQQAQFAEAHYEEEAYRLWELKAQRGLR